MFGRRDTISAASPLVEAAPAPADEPGLSARSGNAQTATRR